MSFEYCCECNREVLTEADDYVVTPKEAYSIRCIKCYFKKLQKENEELKAKKEKLENLILLTDKSVSDLVVDEKSLKQYSEYVKCFPDENPCNGVDL